MSALLLVIPAVPLSDNAWKGRHWSVRAREAKRWRDLVGVARLAAGIKEGIQGRVVVTLEFRTRRDPSNLLKQVLDALVHCGLIEDDSPRILAELRVRAVPGKPPQTRVLIESEVLKVVKP